MPASEQAYTNASSRSANSSSETFGSWSIARISAASSALSGIISSSAGAAAAARGSAAAIATSFIREATLLTRADADDTELDHFRSEEHTSELQSRENLVCRLLLEK